MHPRFLIPQYPWKLRPSDLGANPDLVGFLTLNNNGCQYLAIICGMNVGLFLQIVVIKEYATFLDSVD